jgi:hypothetical protein
VGLCCLLERLCTTASDVDLRDVNTDLFIPLEAP